MATVNYSWALPTVGASVNTWGTLVNNILIDIDAKMFPRTGGTISGNVSVTGALSASGIISASGNSYSVGDANALFSKYSGDGYIQMPSGGTLQIWKSTTDVVATFSSTGLAVAGSVSATGASSNNQLILERTGSATGKWGIHTHSNSLFFNDNVASADRMVIDASGNLNMTAGGHIGRTATASGIFFNTNSVLPSTGTGATDNTVSAGSASYRWTTIYATTGAINTSDARAKTKVRTLADAEIEAAIEHSKEIGIFQWLDAVAKKGEKARQHIGMTVQRSIEIMESHGLDPMSYAFICHDVWADEFKEHPAIDAVEAKAAVLDDEGNEVEPAIEAVEGKDAWTEQTQTAGDRYAFRYDQLNLFIARGIEARLAALEARA